MRAMRTTKTRITRARALALKSMRMTQRAHVKAMNAMRRSGVSVMRPARNMMSMKSPRTVIRKRGR